MKKLIFILLICLTASYGFSESIFQDSFEYANTEGETEFEGVDFGMKALAVVVNFAKQLGIRTG